MERPSISTSIGKTLRDKREANLLTVDEVASSLRLSKEYIDAIEQDRYPSIPLTYLKGYIRAYAKLLAISETDNLSILELLSVENSMGSWRVFSSHKQISINDRFMRWITYGIALTLILLVVMWWKSDKLLYKNLSVNDVMPSQALYQMAENSNLPSQNRGK